MSRFFRSVHLLKPCIPRVSAPLCLTFGVAASITTDKDNDTNATKGLFTNLLHISPSESEEEIIQENLIEHKVEYKHYIYGPFHWAVSPASFQKYGICVMNAYNHNYIVMLNPTDSTGYRLIVRLLSNSNDTVNTTFNRQYSQSEINGLFMVLSSISNILSDEGLIGQVYVLGNSSQSFDEVSRDTLVGRLNEPGFLHGHIVFRGDSEYEYIDGIKLNGPFPGYAKQLGAINDKIDINKSKIKWKDDQIEDALKYFKEKLIKMQGNKDYCILKVVDNRKPFQAEEYVDMTN